MPTIPLADAAARLGVPESVVLADVVRGTKPAGDAPENILGHGQQMLGVYIRHQKVRALR